MKDNNKPQKLKQIMSRLDSDSAGVPVIQSESGKLLLKVPKAVATVNICGVLFVINDDNQHFVKPTKRQIKNLKKHFGIDVQLSED